jgi:hypothetical protein
MPLAGLEPTFLASHGSQTHTLDRAATWIGKFTLFSNNNSNMYNHQSSFPHLPKSLQITTSKLPIFTFYIYFTMTSHFNTIIRFKISP